MTFTRTAVYLCISIIVFTLAVNFINSLGAFPTTYEGDGYVVTETRPKFQADDRETRWSIKIKDQASFGISVVRATASGK